MSECQATLHILGALASVFALMVAQVPPSAAMATYPSEFRFNWCVGDQCFDHSISAAHFQLRIFNYYAEGSRPPVREAFFVATLPAPYQRELLLSCPGLVVLAYMLLAEVRLYTHPPEEAGELMARVNVMMGMPEIAGPHQEGVHKAWPYAAALERYETVALQMQAARPLSLDIVLPHCREDLSWLGDRTRLETFPKRTRVFVYEKCGGQSAELVHILETHVQLVNVALDDAVDPFTGLAARRDECTAYLAHVVSQYHDNPAQGTGLADMTLFLHGDPGDHTPLGLLNLVLRGFASGGFRHIEFLHLGAPRMVYASNPCQEHIFEAAIGRPLRPPLSTYCCSQFGVTKNRIRARPWEDYVRMLSLVDGSAPDMCQRTGPAYEKYDGQRLSHCYFFEFMWHVIFGEQEYLPLRADDSRFPPALRLKDNEESLPSLWHSYLGGHVGGQATFHKQGHQRWLMGISEPAVDTPRAQQVNYGDLVPEQRR